MRIIFLGSGDFAVPALRRLAERGHVIVAALSQPDRPTGRGLVVRPTPVHAAAKALGVPHVQMGDVNAAEHSRLWVAAEIGVVAAFGQKIAGHVLKALPRGCVNIHGSLLPKYRGAAPYQWAILNGERVTGVTVFQLDERWDAGPIWGQRELEIGETETADELHDRLAGLGAELIGEVLPAIAAGTLRPLPQERWQATRAPKLTKADAAVRLDVPARQLVRRIHGLWSWPAATCVFASRSGKREQVQLARARVVDQVTAAGAETPAGSFLPDRTVQADPGRVELLEVKPAGGKLMAFAAFANGRRIAPPDRLSPLALPGAGAPPAPPLEARQAPERPS